MKILRNKIRLSSVIYILLFIFALVAVRWSWHNQLSLSNPARVEQGVLDLHGIDFEHSSSITLDGEWLFYPGQWIGASNLDEASQGQMLQVPGNWNALFDSTENNAYGYGTYYLRILLNHPLSD